MSKEISMLFGHGRNTLKPQCFPKACDIIRLHDSGTGWSSLEPTKGNYNWTTLDAHLAAAEVAGIPVLYVFSRTPEWTAQPGFGVGAGVPGIVNPTSNRPPLLQDWSDFIAALLSHVRRADGTFRIQYWEMWNETNALQFWNGSDAQLLAMAKILYQLVKAYSPTMQVTTPTPCWNTTSADAAMNTYFSEGFQQYADIVSFHGYQALTVPAMAIGLTIDNMYAVMADYGVTKPLWDTEYGFGDPTRLSYAQQRQWVMDSLIIRLQKRLGASIAYQWDNLTHMTCVSWAGVLTAAGHAFVDFYSAL